MEQLLDLIGELIRLFFPQIFNPRRIVRQTLILQRRFQDGVLEPVELQRIEQQLGGDGAFAPGDLPSRTPASIQFRSKKSLAMTAISGANAP